MKRTPCGLTVGHWKPWPQNTHIRPWLSTGRNRECSMTFNTLVCYFIIFTISPNSEVQTGRKKKRKSVSEGSITQVRLNQMSNEFWFWIEKCFWSALIEFTYYYNWRPFSVVCHNVRLSVSSPLKQSSSQLPFLSTLEIPFHVTCAGAMHMSELIGVVENSH